VVAEATNKRGDAEGEFMVASTSATERWSYLAGSPYPVILRNEEPVISSGIW